MRLLSASRDVREVKWRGQPLARAFTCAVWPHVIEPSPRLWELGWGLDNVAPGAHGHTRHVPRAGAVPPRFVQAGCVMYAHSLGGWPETYLTWCLTKRGRTFGMISVPSNKCSSDRLPAQGTEPPSSRPPNHHPQHEENDNQTNGPVDPFSLPPRSNSWARLLPPSSSPILRGSTKDLGLFGETIRIEPAAC